MKMPILALIVLALSGCGSLKLSNRISTTADGETVYVTSWWQWFGVTVEIDPRDAAALKAKGQKP